ncbi:MAG: MFS transporter, partial [Acidobacteria bacterium]|nr:MFS transporter [Acidobacteriota bacterium]
ARVLHAAGVAIISAGVLIQLTQSLPMRLRGRMMGYFGLPGFVMLGLGPVVSEWLLYRWDFRILFLSLPVLFLTIGGVLYRLPRAETERSEGCRPRLLEALRASYGLLRSVLFFSVIFGFCFSAWHTFIAPAVQPRVGTGGVSAYGLGYGLGAILTRLGLSHRLDHGAGRYLSISTLALYGISLASIPYASTAHALVGLGLVCGMAHGTYYPSLSSIAAERFHPLHGGQGMSLYISASSLGMFLGPPVWGTITDRAGYGAMFVLAGLTLTAATIVFVAAQYRARHIRPWSEDRVLERE